VPLADVLHPQRLRPRPHPSMSSQSSWKRATVTIIITTIIADGHHHGHGGLKHYHDEDMQSLSLKNRPGARSGQVLFPGSRIWWLRKVRIFSAPKASWRFKGRPQALCLPGRPNMMLDGDHQRGLGRDSEKARKAAIIFIGRELPGEHDPQRLRGMRSVIAISSPAGSSVWPWLPLTRRQSADRARPIAAGAAVVGAYFSRRPTAVLVLGDEALLFVAANGDPQRVVVHGGAILAAASDGERIVTGGDDGKVVATKARYGRTATIAADSPSIAGSITWPSHRMVRSAGQPGKDAFVQPPQGRARASSKRRPTVGGLAFAPKRPAACDPRITMGVTLWFPQCGRGHTRAAGVEGLPPRRHPSAPTDANLVTAMQEPNAPRLAPGRRQAHCACPGYSAKVARRWAWTAGGKGLATSGAPQLIVWPFHGKDGPDGKKKPHMPGGPPSIRSALWLAIRKKDVIAAGYDNGLVLLVRTTDGAEVLARPAPDGSPVSALAWNAKGTAIAFGTEEGEAGIVDPGLRALSFIIRCAGLHLHAWRGLRRRISCGFPQIARRAALP